jgi:hypothetical protein
MNIKTVLKLNTVRYFLGVTVNAPQHGIQKFLGSELLGRATI